MKNQNILQLQKRAKKLMQLSSDQSDPGFVNEQLQKVIGKIGKPQIHKIDNPSQNTQLLNKCLKLINQNKCLKQELSVTNSKCARFQSQLQKSKQYINKLQKMLTQSNQKKSKSKNKQRQVISQGLYNNEQSLLKKYGKMEAEKEQCQKKCMALLQLVKNEKKKTRKLSQFIQDRLPSLQLKFIQISSKIDAKLQAHFEKEFNI